MAEIGRCFGLETLNYPTVSIIAYSILKVNRHYSIPYFSLQSGHILLAGSIFGGFDEFAEEGVRIKGSRFKFGVELGTEEEGVGLFR